MTTLSASNKRIYIMNKHKININDRTANAFNNTQTQSGIYLWTQASEAQDLSNDANVLTMFPNKNNFTNVLRTNLTKFDTYIGQDYTVYERALGIKLSTVKIESVAGLENSTYKIKANADTLALLTSDQTDNLGFKVKETDNSLRDGDIVLDATSGFYGKINIKYRVSDSMGNESSEVTSTFFVLPYSNVRVKRIDNDNDLFLLSDSPITFGVTYENGYSDDDFDFINLDSNSTAIRTFLKKITTADIDFTNLQITKYTENGASVSPTNKLAFGSTINNNNVRSETATHIRKIQWKQTVKLNYRFTPTAEGRYAFNSRVVTNIRSITANSSTVVTKMSDVIINVCLSETEYFQNLDVNNLTVSGTGEFDSLSVTNNISTATLETTGSVTVGSDLIVNGDISFPGDTNAFKLFGLPIIKGMSSTTDIHLVPSGNNYVEEAAEFKTLCILAIKNTKVSGSIKVYTTDISSGSLPLDNPSYNIYVGGSDGTDYVNISAGKTRIFIRIMFDPSTWEPSAEEF
jgi:hypothetical protein